MFIKESYYNPATETRGEKDLTGALRPLTNFKWTNKSKKFGFFGRGWRKFLTCFIIIIAAVFFIGRYFYYFDWQNKCFLRLKPSLLEFSSSNIKGGIRVLKYAVPDEYQKLCHYVKVINPNISCGGFQGGCYSAYRSNPKEIDIGTSHQDFLGWTAAVISHETCHAAQFQEGRDFSESECHQIDNQVLKTVVEF